MNSLLKEWIEERKVLIAGFGREGRSTLRVLSRFLNREQISLADINPAAIGIALDQGFRCYSGTDYLNEIHSFDIIIKSPGIPQKLFDAYEGLLTTQVDLFFRFFAKNSIGITGTKGKSTTSSLIQHLLLMYGRHTLLAGNIGVPIFDILDQIKAETVIVCELSAHQLQTATHVPSLSIMLNLFPEHLDHFETYDQYQTSKSRIGTLQKKGDVIIIPYGNEELRSLLSTAKSQQIWVSLEGEQDSDTPIHDGHYWVNVNGKSEQLLSVNFKTGLKGYHNRFNVLCAAVAAHLNGLDAASIQITLPDFKPLPHRLEFVGEYHGIRYYNDSIATIPQATLAAIEALGRVDTLILGGFDRGLDYKVLYEGLLNSGVRNIILIGAAGKRMCSELPAALMESIGVECLNDMAEAVALLPTLTPAGGVCLLSPAAASYDQYSGFEQRGEDFKTRVRALNA